MAKDCIASWHKYMPDWEYKLCNEDNFDIQSVPYVKEAYESRKFAFVTDYVRLWALYTEGGVYMDTDVEILKPLDDLMHLDAFTGYEGSKYQPPVTGLMASAAQGEWVWFVDADDVVDMRYVEDMMRWLQSHEGADMAMFDLQSFRDGETVNFGSEAPRPMVVAEMADLEEFMECYDCSHHQRLWYRRETLHDLRFSVGIRVGEDLEFQYKFLTLCRSYRAKYSFRRQFR